MTHPTVPTEHRLTGGSVGGPGENSAECACGIVFHGLDTHAEATTLLDQHIKDAAYTRRADQLVTGDWITSLITDQDEVSGPGQITHVETYSHVGGSRVLVVLRELGEEVPQICYLAPADEVALLSADEIVDLAKQARREKFASQITELARLIVAEKLPIDRDPGFVVHLKSVEEVEQVGAALGIKPSEFSRQVSVTWPRQEHRDGVSAMWLAYRKDEPKPEAPVEPMDEAR